MPITASTLYRDSFNFIRNQFLSILLLSLLITFVSIMLDKALRPDIPVSELQHLLATLQEHLKEHKPLPETQMYSVLKIWLSLFINHIITTTLLVGGVVTLLSLTSQGQRLSALQALGASTPILPLLMLFFIFYILLVSIGTFMLILPGIIIAVSLSLSPIILVVDNKGIFAAIRQSCKKVFRHISLVVPAFLLWLPARMIFPSNPMSIEIISIVFNTLNNLVTAFVLIYLFRLYMLTR